MKKPIVDQYERMILREVPDSFTAQCLVVRKEVANLKRVLTEELCKLFGK